MSHGFSTVFDVALPDTGLYEGFEFIMSAGDAKLTINIAERPKIELNFARARWHEFVALYNCSAEQINSAYFKPVEIVDSTEMSKYVQNEKSPPKAYKDLHHYRVFLDESGCREIFAESWSLL